MKHTRLLVRSVVALLTVVALTAPVALRFAHTTPNLQIAGDDPKIPTGG